MALLLADPRTELSVVPEPSSTCGIFHTEYARQVIKDSQTAFAAAAYAGSAGALQLLLSDDKMHLADQAAAGREILRGFRAGAAECLRSRQRGRHVDLSNMLSVAAVLHSLIAAEPAGELLPDFVRNAVDASRISARTWARRRGAVLARVQAMKEL